MEDGSGKCLLDVISDPSALSEFLESQALLDGDSSPIKGHSFQSTSVPNQVHVGRTVHTSLSSNNVATSQQQFITQTSASARSTVQNVSSTIPVVSMVNTSNPQTLVRSINGPVNVSNSPVVIPISSKSSSPINNLLNVTKGITMSPVTYQGKKPIPIQPKNPVILPNTSMQSGVSALGNVRPGLVSQTPTSLISNQLHGGVLPRGGAVNGVDSSKTRTTPVQPRPSQPTILSTPPKRIAPKQVISPSTNASLTAMSPVRIQQASLQNKQNIQLATQLLQTQNTASANSNTNKNFSQQLAAVVQPITNNNQTNVAQPLSTNTAQPVQQIQQLINDKLSGQQAQPLVQAAPVQQKVFTQAQLETALKQSQLLAQNSPGQQNILVQQQILRQLIQQAQQLQQQKTTAKTTTSNINIQPVTTSTQGLVQQPQQQQQVRQVIPRQVGNQFQTGNQIQMVLPNQQIVTLAQNILQTNQQNAGQTVAYVNASNVNQNLKTTTQPMVIVSQSNGNFVLQQNLKPSSSGSTTNTATTVNIPLQSLLNHQQKQIASQLVNTTRTNQTLPQQVKVGGNLLLQVNQPNQVGQQTILIQNQVGQAQNITKPATQQNVVIQAKPNVATTQPNTTIQQLTPAQLQQIQNLGGVQKVLIIKQPDVVQKLANAQGAKGPQAIQITPQQLQVLQQIQNPQTSTGQKIIIQNKADGSNPSTTILSAQQLKQLQQSLIQQGGNTKIIQIPQTQRQVLVQQVQQQGNKTAGKMAHVPRILQTSGRHATNQSSKSSTVKQEPNRGVKRPHADTPEPPKVVRRLKSALYQDQQGVLHPDIHTPFKSKLEAIKKLTSYHVCHDPGQTPEDIKKSEGAFENVASQLINRSEKMMEKYRSLMLTESTRQEPSSEMVMLYRLYLADERASLALNKKQLADELKILRSIPHVSMPPPSTPVVNATTTTTNDEKTPESEPTPTKPRTPSPTITMETEKELDILSADALLATPEDHSLLTNDDDDDDDDDEGSDVDMEENEIDKAVFNMESAASYYEPVNHLSDSLIDSPRTSTPHNDGDDSVDELLVDDDDVEKEDVTATLALLHSMAEELDGTIS